MRELPRHWLLNVFQDTLGLALPALGGFTGNGPPGGVTLHGLGIDLIIGRASVDEFLRGHRGPDLIIAQIGDTVVPGRWDDVILMHDALEDHAVFTVQARPGILRTVDFALPDMRDPDVQHVSRDGIVSIRDRDGHTAEIHLVDRKGEALALSAPQAARLERRFDIEGADAPILSDLVFDGRGNARDQVLIGGSQIKAGPGRDVLVADADTMILRGGAGGDLLLLDSPGRGVMLDGGSGTREGGAPGVDTYVLTGFGAIALGDEECVIWDLINGHSGPVHQPSSAETMWDVLGDAPATRAAFDRIAAFEVDYMVLPEFDPATTTVGYEDEGLLAFQDASGTTAHIRFATNDRRLYDEDEIVHEFAGRVFVGQDPVPLTADQFLIDMSVAGLLGRLGEAAFAVDGAPAPSTGLGADLLLGGGAGGAGGDLLIGRAGVRDRLDGQAGGDLILAQGGDTVLVDLADTIVLKRGTIEDPNVVTLEAPFLDTQDLTYILPEITIALPEMQTPEVASVRRDGFVTLRDGNGDRFEMRLLDGDGEQVRLTNRQVDQLRSDLVVQGAGGSALEGVAFDGAGTSGDDLLIGGVRLMGQGGRDLLISDSATTEMRGGAQDDFLISEGGILMDGGAGFDLYVLVDAPSAAAPRPTDPGCLVWDIVDGSAVEGSTAMVDQERDPWDVFGDDFQGPDLPYRGDALWLPEFDAATLTVRLAGEAVAFRDASGRTEQVMFESAADGRLLGRDDLDQFLGRIFAGPDGTAVTDAQFDLG